MRRAKFGKVRSLSIPNEIIYLIFLELPVKSILKFKCVSKEWYLIMEEREFIESHRLRSQARAQARGVCFRKLRVEPGKYGSHVLLIKDFDGNPESTGIELDQYRLSLQLDTVWQSIFSIKFFWRQLRQSVLGLVCFGDIILNPSTKEAIKLPDHEDFLGYIPERFRNPQCDVIRYGIGFDHLSKKYKALMLFSNIKEDRMILARGKENFEPLLLARVLTLGTDSSWRNVNVSIPYEWASTERLFSYIRDEKFRLLRSFPGDQTMSVHIIEFVGRLGILSPMERGHIWVLEDYEKGEWTKRKILSNKQKCSLSDIKSDDFIIYKDVESIFPLKQITMTDQPIWRWGRDQN